MREVLFNNATQLAEHVKALINAVDVHADVHYKFKDGQLMLTVRTMFRGVLIVFSQEYLVDRVTEIPSTFIAQRALNSIEEEKRKFAWQSVLSN